MLTYEMILSYARQLDNAEQTGRAIDALSMVHADMTFDDAYRVQKAWIDVKLARGRKIIGKKIGLTSRAMQQAMQINEPDFGILLDDMMFENGAMIKASGFIDPRIEVELAFKLKQDLVGDDLSVEDVLMATEYIVPALELIAARSYRIHPETGYVRKVHDTIADNAANAGIIIGNVRIDPHHPDLPWVSALLDYNGTIEETGVAAGVLGHPANGIIWLTRRIAPFGMRLKAGEIILAGSFTRPVACHAGDKFVADYHHFGKIEVSFI